jgi:CheY-like chemotaxis protein
VSCFILIVEDSPQMAVNLEVALAGVGGADIQIATSGNEALRLLDTPGQSPLAAVVTDLELPLMSGYEFIETLRAQPRYRRTPIIVASGSVDPQAPDRAIEAGADAYFAKPYSPAELRRKLVSLLEERSQ